MKNRTGRGALRGLRLLGATLLASMALGSAGAANSSATIIGLNEGGSWDQVSVGGSGADIFRISMGWRLVTEQGNWHLPAAWEKSLDPKVEDAAKNGYPILGLFAERETTGPNLYQYYLVEEEPNWIEFQRYVKAAVMRYGRGGEFWAQHPGLPYHPITVWEVWNEPNQSKFTPGGTPNPKQYAEFLVATSNTIKGAQAERLKPGEPNDTVVLHAGLLSTSNPSSSHMKVSTYVAQASSVFGYGNAFDGFGLHPYALNGSGREIQKQRLDRFKEYVIEGRSALESIGSSKPIWITELGWPAVTAGGIVGTPSEQASLLTQAFNWAKARSDVAEITWYNYQDSAGESWDRKTGLRDINGGFRPSWAAFRAQAGAVGPYPGGIMSFQANTSALVTNYTLVGGENTGQGMMTGTSPSVARLATGGYQSAFQANNSQLYIWGPAGKGSTGQGMMTGTSPSIAGLVSSGYQVAFQANTSALITIGSAGNVNTGLGMMTGTSPSISGLTGSGYLIAFQANTGQLWTAGTPGTTNWGLGMAAGTSPSITYLVTGGAQIAFQSSGGQLWTTGTPGDHNWGLGMAPGTSPSIAPLSGGGSEVAFQSNAGQLWTVGTAGNQNWGLAMAPGTSPSIVGRPDGSYQVAFQSSAGQLVTVGPNIVANTGQGMAKGTSPEMAPE